MIMEDKEFRFWTSVDKLPNYMEQGEWDGLVIDYHERMVKLRLDGIQTEMDRLDAIFQTLELTDLNDISTYGILPKMVEIMVDVVNVDGVNYLTSKQWDENLCLFDDMWTYEDNAKERAQYYNTIGNHHDDDKYEQWLDYQSSEEFLHGTTGTTIEIPTVDLTLETVEIEGKHRRPNDKEWLPLDEPLREVSDKEKTENKEKFDEMNKVLPENIIDITKTSDEDEYNF